MLGVIGQECQGILRLHVPVIVVCKQSAQTLAVCGIVSVQMHVLLGAVQHLDVDAVALRPPCDVGQVAFLVKIGDIHPYGCALVNIVNSQGDYLGCHAVHGVAYLLERACAGGYVQQREQRNTALILLVERNLAAVGRYEYTTVYAEFVTAHCLAAYNALLIKGCNLMLNAVTV